MHGGARLQLQQLPAGLLLLRLAQEALQPRPLRLRQLRGRLRFNLRGAGRLLRAQEVQLQARQLPPHLVHALSAASLRRVRVRGGARALALGLRTQGLELLAIVGEPLLIGGQAFAAPASVLQAVAVPVPQLEQGDVGLPQLPDLVRQALVVVQAQTLPHLVAAVIGVQLAEERGVPVQPGPRLELGALAQQRLPLVPERRQLPPAVCLGRRLAQLPLERGAGRPRRARLVRVGLRGPVRLGGAGAVFA
mmetsp:Transcript_39098/g.111942  ORF Transcript_39098/g.111942 Transcript_39098/m.111942 type:complete len:249 (+) Transcript_39098:682-1428(+)